MDVEEIEQLRGELAAFVAEVFTSVPRRDRGHSVVERERTLSPFPQLTHSGEGFRR
ncbi:hypothetical protein [Streptosporangium roseum]|uniref:hypothetical protein n=1 Tax=Streptosporangium roseum TaxID=2001 RepID=UPI000AD3720C|nr:hypothetical protein [Streptosporangium roseum]